MATGFLFSTLILYFILLKRSFGGDSRLLPTLSIQWYEFSCIGGDNALLSTGLWLSYTSNSTDETGTDDQTYSCRVWVNYNSPVPELQYYEGAGPRNITSLSFTFEQPEHGGGSCHCFNVSTNNTSSLIERLVIIKKIQNRLKCVSWLYGEWRE